MCLEASDCLGSASLQRNTKVKVRYGESFFRDNSGALGTYQLTGIAKDSISNGIDCLPGPSCSCMLQFLAEILL